MLQIKLLAAVSHHKLNSMLLAAAATVALPLQIAESLLKM